MASLLEKYGWYEWLAHSHFSFLIGSGEPAAFIKAAQLFGYKGFGLCDFDGVYGLVKAYQESKQKNLSENEFKFFYGAEIHLYEDYHLPVLHQKTLVLIAQSHKGYRHLCQIISASRTSGKKIPVTHIRDLLSSSVEDLVAIVPMRGLARALIKNTIDFSMSDLRDHFGGRLYFALGSFGNRYEDWLFERIMGYASSLGCPLILSSDAFFISEKDKMMSDLVQAIRLNKPLDHCGHHLFPNAEHRLHSLKEIEVKYKNLKIWEDCLRYSRLLSESIDFSFSELKYEYPKEMIPQGLTAQVYLEQLVIREATQRYPMGFPDRVRAQCDRELCLIADLGFADYFLTVWDIVAWARSQGILCQGRGSAANSAVCFVLGVTSVDPSLFELLFERFMSAERGDPPDIDVDFEHERREEVIQYIYKRYGRHRAAMVANIICFRTKGAVRAVGLALGVSRETTQALAKSLSTVRLRRSPLELAFHELKNQSQMPGKEIDAHIIDLWVYFAKTLMGVPRHLGLHSGGFVITERSLDELCPVEPASMEGRSVVQWSKDDIEVLGIFKIDILALGMLTALRKAFDLVKDNFQKSLSLAEIPSDDFETYSMVQKADTVGTFQVESRAQMSMLGRLQPKCFYDLVIQIAIIRPGPIQGGLIHPYLRRRDGLDKIEYAHPLAKEILKRTLGVPIFQEQVMRISMELGDFTPGEADELRRNMGSWKLKGDVNPWVIKLKRGLEGRGISATFVDQMVGQLKGFSAYGFPESHAASFAFIAYASCYLKRHYPECFLVALLNSQPMGFYSPAALIEDARRHGVRVKGLCVFHSGWESCIEKGPDGLVVRLGFHLVKSLRQDIVEKLVAHRDAASWSDFISFAKHTGMSRSDLLLLACCGSLESLGVDRREAVWLSAAASFAPLLEDERSGDVNFAQESPLQKVQVDFHSFGATLGDHPSSVVKKHSWFYKIKQSEITVSTQLNSLANGLLVYVFGMLLIRQAPPTAKGMVFLTLEDDCGFINIALTPDFYKKNYKLVENQGFLCFFGVLQRQKESHSVLARQLIPMSQERSKAIPLRRSLKSDQTYFPKQKNRINLSSPH